jgi:hypothetical protein
LRGPISSVPSLAPVLRGAILLFLQSVSYRLLALWSFCFVLSRASFRGYYLLYSFILSWLPHKTCVLFCLDM